MNSELLIEKIDDHFVSIIINRPAALNAINRPVMEGLLTFFTENRGQADIYGVIISGAGEKAFAAGADITQFTEVDEKEGTSLSALGHEAFNAIESFHVPVIAAVNGFALGGGCELAMACHLRVVSKKAKFGQPEVNLGLVPGYGGTQRLPQLIGKGRALELLLTADMIDAQKALEWGLANELVEPGEEFSKSLEILKKIASKGPQAISQIIELVNSHYHDPKSYTKEIHTFGKLLTTDECIEGVEAFLEKRKANFRK